MVILKKKSNIVILPNASTLMEMKKEIMKAKGIDVANSMYKIGESAGNDFGHFIRDVKSKKNKIGTKAQRNKGTE